jgi:hypothetical protein
MGLTRNTSLSTSNIGRSHLRSGEEILWVKTYNCDPKDVKVECERIEELLEKWKDQNDGQFRYVIDVRKTLVHVTMIKTISNVKVRTLKEEQDKIKTEQDKIKEDIVKIKDKVKIDDDEPEPPVS